STTPAYATSASPCIHAATVISPDIPRLALFCTFTYSSAPSNLNALLSTPLIQVGPPDPLSAPLFPFPEESAATLVLPSSNFQYPTSPCAWAQQSPSSSNTMAQNIVAQVSNLLYRSASSLRPRSPRPNGNGNICINPVR